MNFLQRLFHKHHWNLISANISGGPISGFGACATLECTKCGKREFFERANEHGDFFEKFPSKLSAKVWVESLLPPGHRELSITEDKR